MINFSNLPKELTSKILVEHLDEKSSFECAKVCKLFNRIISEKILNHHRYPINSSVNPYTQLTDYYRNYCLYFLQKLPYTFNINDCLTLIDAKLVIDSILSSNDYARVIQLWDDFIHMIDPTKFIFSKDYPMKNFHLSNSNQEINFLIHSGIDKIGSNLQSSFDLIKIINHQKWCTPETLQLLIEKNFHFETEFLFKAIENKEYHKILPSMFNKLLPESKEVQNILQKVNASFDPSIDDYSKMPLLHLLIALDSKTTELTIKKILSKCKEVDSTHINLALKNGFSKELIIELLRLYKGNVDSKHIKLALKNHYANSLIFKLLNRCTDTLTSNHVLLAISSYPNSLIKKILNKIDSKNENAKLSYSKIFTIISSYDFFINFFDLILEKTKKDDVDLVKKKFYIEPDG